VSSKQVDQEWKKLESAISNYDLGSSAETNPSEKKPFSFLRLVAAASIIAILGFSVNHFWFSASSDLAVRSVEKKTSNGQQLTVKLPDGTRVKLNAGSILSYPKVFEDTLREISLTGEAFFDVVRNEKSPFIIHTGNITTRVLGTSFNIRAYPENKEIQVAVVEGKVKVRTESGSGENGVCLIKSEMVTVQKEHGKLIVSDYDEKEQIGWKDGILYFEKSDFLSTVRRLERWYGVRINIGEGRKMDPSWRFSGRFKDKPLNYILDVMSYPHQFSYKINNNTVNLQ
jgi:ferric-dicitrate binding protein FerR (iron transport regulator)